MDLTVPNHFVPTLVSLSLRFQLGPDRLFKRAGIDLAAAREPGARFSVSEVERLVEAFIAETKLPQLGLLLGERVDPESLGLFGQLVATSRSPRDAIATFSDFKWLLHPSFDLRVEEKNKMAIVCYASHDDAPIGNKPYYAEALLSALATLGQHFLEVGVTPLRATFRHPRPAYIVEYERIFRCPTQFEQSYDALYYPERSLDVTMLSHSKAYHRTLRAQAETDLGHKELLRLSQVRRVIHARLAEPDLNLSAVASALAVSSRTLQRRLREGAAGFREMRDDIRYQRARELLALRDVTMEEIASALGYRDRSNFVRAFTRWSGKSPSRYRVARRFGAK